MGGHFLLVKCKGFVIQYAQDCCVASAHHFLPSSLLSGMTSFHTTFQAPLDSSFIWLHEPDNWTIDDSVLVIHPAKQTDAWQRTHYGFQHANAPALLREVTGDFVVETTCEFDPKHQYDQAGLMVHFSDEFWIKTSVEYETQEYGHLGAVVTNHGYSDWSTQRVNSAWSKISFKIEKTGSDFVVSAKLHSEEAASSSLHSGWLQLRVCHLHCDTQKVLCGPYACCPIEAGYEARFHQLKYDHKS